ncbi:hypothetical protein [Mesorhizobium sp. M8A.F.Ca.ET.021.01.1.1]|uniref:hypothetical protein n=1 Tax=Mesorhizobium sp. M8A.F.Ca.ET.021.01.1.1 TaxID=2496757 RepID=UPI000FCB9272|nr:hypothetical protein [Mesorhizobium sp. M8A.F.Ca.ET.021.01.1.1]RUW56374.1 hypothetical protein EOA36_04505 [Mesorhizobium sp. M8A.F.Ca.ET.021.01.1.1]
MKQKRIRRVKWVVGCGSGVAKNPEFDNEADAVACYEKEIAIPSYFGHGHNRSAEIIKVTTITERIR